MFGTFLFFLFWSSSGGDFGTDDSGSRTATRFPKGLYVKEKLSLFLKSHPYNTFPLTEPEAVKNLTVTKITTSSVYLCWSEPSGNRSSYQVQWTNGTKNWSINVNETSHNVTELTPGGHYCFTVIAVAGDKKTTSDVVKTCQHTSKMTEMSFADSGVYLFFSYLFFFLFTYVFCVLLL